MIASKYGGKTLAEFWMNSDVNAATRSDLLTQVQTFVHEIRSHGVLHNDLHPRNILVREEKSGSPQIGIIDWGWASAHCFNLSGKERAWLDKQLQANHDWSMFLSSMEFLDEQLGRQS
jgi:tRNA A-37 threonylcarbamoyl transferase component Bud32